LSFQADVLSTVKKINKACETKNDGIHISPIKDTPQKDKTRKKVANDDDDDFPSSPCPGAPCYELPSI
jgi:hypothetical protein